MTISLTVLVGLAAAIAAGAVFVYDTVLLRRERAQNLIPIEPYMQHLRARDLYYGVFPDYWGR